MSVIDKILDIEYRMFMAVNAEGDPQCRKDAGMFRIHRGSQFASWSDETKNSYLEDLKTAEAQGLNLMTYKYARMDDLVPAENNSPLIEKIVSIQIEWQKEMFEKYPVLMKNARGLTSNENSSLSVSFKHYLSAELESYSARTLELLYDDILKYRSEGINMSEKVYETLVEQLGYSSLEQFKQE